MSHRRPPRAAYAPTSPDWWDSWWEKPDAPALEVETDRRRPLGFAPPPTPSGIVVPDVGRVRERRHYPAR